VRKTFAATLAGVDFASVQDHLGHSKIALTGRYAHSLADVKMAAVCKLNVAGSCFSPDPD
jgi:site-specific recombinase XerD